MNRWEAVWRAADVWQRWALVALAFAAVGQASFVVIYARRPWWRHFVGRALLLKSASLLLILWLSLINSFVAYPGQEPIAAGVLWLTGLAIWYQVAAISRTPPHVYPPDDRHDPEVTP